MTDWDSVREMLQAHIEVYYVRDEETNRKREKEKEQTIDWIISELKEGALPGGTSARLPDFTYIFGGVVWDVLRKAVMMIQPDCYICGQPTREVHHIRPRFLKGTDHPRNVVGLCLECHDQIHRDIDSGIGHVLEQSLMVAKWNFDNRESGLRIAHSGEPVRRE